MPITLPDDEIKKLWEQVQSARHHVLRKDKERIKEDRRLYEGEHYPDDSIYSPDGFLRVVDNVGASNAEIMWSSLAYQAPQYRAEPEDKSSMEEEAALTLEMKLSDRVTRDFIESRGWTACRAALLDVVAQGGNGIVMTMWDHGTEDPTVPQDPDQAEQLAQLALTSGVDARALEPATPTVGEGGRCVRIDPLNFVKDPTVGWDNFHDAAFMGRVYAVPLEELKRSLKRDKDVQDLSGTADLRQNEYYHDLALKDTFEPTERHSYAILVEMWYRRMWLKNGYTDPTTQEKYPAGYYPVKVTWSTEKPEDPLLIEAWPYDVRDERGERQYPFDVLFGRLVPGSWKAQSLIQVCEPQQRELNKERTILATSADLKTRAKWYVQKGVLGDAKNVFEDTMVGGLIEGQGSASERPVPIDMPTANPEVELMGEHAIRDMNTNSGVSEAAQGVAIQGVHTATEANLVANQSGARFAVRQVDWEQFLSSIAQKLYQMRVQFSMVGDTASVTMPRAMGGNGSAQSMQIQKPDLQEARIKIVTGSTMLQNLQEEVAHTLQFIQTAAQLGCLATPQTPMGFINSRVLFEDLAVKLKIDSGNNALWNVTEFVQMAQEQMMQQAQMQAQATMAALTSQGSPQGGPGGPPQGLPQGGPPQGGAPAPGGPQGATNPLQQLLAGLAGGGPGR